jgi:glycogen debranching enzyme
MAMWVNYESTVAPRGNFKRPTILMSKNWMTACWSWDHCFNAMAHSYTDPDTAWDQLNVHFDLQDKHGCLPDGVKTPVMGWNFCKPPIHGWTLSKMMQNRDLLTKKRLKKFYGKLTRWTEWWLKNRDYDGDGLCEYHHGNDSGWDNSTVFDGGFPVAGADLAAFLILQMDMLSVMAAMQKKKKQVKKWRKRAGRMLELMIEKLWDGDQFRAKKAFTCEAFPNGDSLINYLPIILGKRLPKEIRGRVADGLDRFVTEFGPATENPASPLYLESGYWRGPIWGPEVVIICDGLARGGYRKQARDIAKRYCNMCRKHGIFAENYDPLSGEPLCDKAYTWGSSAFLILAHELI